MTYLIIGSKYDNQVSKLNSFFNDYFKKDFTSITDWERISDIHFLDGQESSSIGIEEVKELQSKMVYKPFSESVQVGVISFADRLTHQAQNALLKTLEESNDYSIYFLLVNNERNLLDTIVSRSRRVYCKRDGKTEDTLYDVKSFLNSDILDRFKYIESFDKDRKGAILFVEEIANFLGRDISSGSLDSLKLLSNTKKKLNANSNIRLTLESMSLSL